MPSVALSGIALARARQPVLEHVTVSVEAGELVLITGRRGAGKSTLLSVAAGLLPPESGQVVVGGRSILALQSGSIPYLRRNIGYLPPQPSFLDEETVLENVMLALAVRRVPVARARGHARAVLEELGLEPLAQQPVARLSAGERRLTGLARALCGPPPVLLLDDPSAGLDDHDRYRIAQTLRRVLAQGSAVLAASSDTALVGALHAQGARVLELEGGRIVGGAPAIRLVDNGDSYETTDVIPSSQLFSEGRDQADLPHRRDQSHQIANREAR